MRALFVSALLAAAPAVAQVDLLAQDLEVDLTSPTQLVVKAVLRLEAERTVSEVKLLLPTGTVTAVTINQAAAPFTADPSQYLLKITLPAPLAAGEEATITIETRDTPACASGGRVECTRSDGFTFMGAISQGVRWYPVAYDSTDPFVGTLSLLLPAGHEAACVQGGVPSKTSLMTGAERWTFAWSFPTDALAFFAARASRLQSTDGHFVGLYRDAVTRPVMETILASAERYYPAMAAMYGPLPGERFHYAFVPQNFMAGAVGQLSLVFLNEFMTTPQYAYIVPQVPHEMAHSWWGNLASPTAPFLSESMAEYTLWRVKSEVDGEREGMKGRRMNAVWYMYGRPGAQDVAILDPNVSRSPVYVHAVYHKGPLVIRALEEWVGKEPFTAGLRKALEVQPSLSPDAWLDAIQTASGKELGRFRARWLASTGFPNLAVTPTITEETNRYRLALEVKGSAEFPMKVPVVVHLEDGKQVKHSLTIDVSSASWTQTFEARPVLIELDREWTAVRELAPALLGDVTFDGTVDGADLIETALHLGGALPLERRVDGSYDPLFDLNSDNANSAADLELIVAESQK